MGASGVSPFRRSAACVLAPAARLTLCDRLWSPYACESRGGACAPVCWADRSVSREVSAAPVSTFRDHALAAAISRRDCAAYTGGVAVRQRNLSAICRHFAAVQRESFARDFPASMTITRRIVQCQAWQAAAITAAVDSGHATMTYLINGDLTYPPAGRIIRCCTVGLSSGPKA